jgi:hypothetical protein
MFFRLHCVAASFNCKTNLLDLEFFNCKTNLLDLDLLALVLTEPSISLNLGTNFHCILTLCFRVRHKIAKVTCVRSGLLITL